MSEVAVLQVREYGCEDLKSFDLFVQLLKAHLETSKELGLLQVQISTGLTESTVIPLLERIKNELILGHQAR